MSKLDRILIWFLAIMFVGSRIWGNTQDTAFWGILWLAILLLPFRSNE